MKELIFVSIFASIIFGFHPVRAEDIPHEIESYVYNELTQYKFFNGRLKKFGFDTYSTSNPWFFVQDFNGDKKLDWIGFFAKEVTNERLLAANFIYDLDLICICSTQEEYVDIELTDYAGYVAEDNSVSVGIFLLPPGVYESQVEGEGEIKTLLHSVEFTDFEKSSKIFFWSNNKFDVLWTSD